MMTAKTLLGNYALRQTGTRAEILSIFLQEQRALSQREIESSMKRSCDRVTIYRTLSTFMEKGLVHKVLDHSGVTKFALCTSECGESGSHKHDHIHFTCTNCGKTLCVDDVAIPSLTLPPGYLAKEVNVLIQGTCANCSLN